MTFAVPCWRAHSVYNHIFCCITREYFSVFGDLISYCNLRTKLDKTITNLLNVILPRTEGRNQRKN